MEPCWRNTSASIVSEYETFITTSFQDRAKEAAWGSTLTPPANSSANLKKRVKVQLGSSENPGNAVSMLVEVSGRISIIEDNGQSRLASSR